MQFTQVVTSVKLLGIEISNILHFFCTPFREPFTIRGKKKK